MGQGRKNRGVRGKIYVGVKHGILTPKRFGKKYFLVHTDIESTL